ncbi:MAG: 3-hydroxyisobutyrate dehydrogenase [Chloroflexota bacterium]|jgi:3-hydroxyisobutyrate dehydrogenase|nr:MAG: NAD(P)-dependent oxidoreductase [SAR202 cluster bacterium]GIT42355.1 MAG: 3-hydroxyisobutyrate dehydrogenase [Chloroflexota bacterium]
MNLGYIGTGVMGNPMAKALIEAGHSVTVHDLNRESATNLCEMGANWADDPRQLSESSEVVFTSLPGPVQAENVLTNPDTGILSGLRVGGTWVDTTTNSPTMIHKLASLCKQRGIEMLDCPVSGRIPNMTMMVGGDQAVFNKQRPVLETMGKEVIYVGGTASGCTAKLVTQYLGYSNFIAGIEGMLIGAKAGLDMDILARLIPISASASGVMERSMGVVLDGTFASNGTLDIVAKDLHLACQLARDVQAPSRIGDIVDDVLQRAQAQGWGQEGYPIVAKVLEQMANSEVRSAKTK